MITSVLIAGEDAVKRSKLASPLISQGYYIIEAESGLRAIELLKRRQNILLALIDVEMSDISGIDFVAKMRTQGLKTPLIALAHREEDSRLQRAMAAGADDFLIYPVSPTRTQVSVGNLLQKYMLRRGFRRIAPNDKTSAVAISKWTTKSGAMRGFLKQAVEAAHSDNLILICGEDATGREDVARAMHQEANEASENSGDVPTHHQEHVKKPPFIFVSCALLIEEYGADFAYEKVLELKSMAAYGGTLCFSDIDRLNKQGQAQFLHFIEQQMKLGHLPLKPSKQNHQDNPPSSFRLIALASADLEDLVAEGSFSMGLYKKLNQHVLNIPPLRERLEDIPDMAESILASLVSETGNATLSGISTTAQNLLRNHNWPGNFAELENILFRAVISSDGRLLVARDFPQLTENTHKLDIANDIGDSSLIFYDSEGHIKPLMDIEREAILAAMRRYRGKISEVARRLHIGRSTLYRKLEEYGLQPDSAVG